MSTFPKLPSPVVPIETFVVPATLDAKRGEEAVQRCIREGLLKPTDIASAELDGPTLLFVPFWRIALSVDGFHVGLSSIQVGKEGRTIPLPTGGSNHREGVLMIGARTIFPYEPKLPSFFGRIGGVPPLEVGMNELVALDAAKDALAAGERVDAEVDEARARSIASDMLVRAVTPSQAIYSNYGAKVTACTFCLYPVYYARSC